MKVITAIAYVVGPAFIYNSPYLNRLIRPTNFSGMTKIVLK
jgi:hypothetical protein